MTPPVRLTIRQREVAELVAARWSGPEIADALHIDVRTVYSHILATADKIRSSGYPCPRQHAGAWLIRKWMGEQSFANVPRSQSA